MESVLFKFKSTVEKVIKTSFQRMRLSGTRVTYPFHWKILFACANQFAV
jgi:hypothetical protein